MVAQSRLAGKMEGNTNLKDRSARLIINEVVGGSRSRLRGATEVLGQKAEYVLANPYGVTCDGCSFENMSRATLTTGRVNLDNDGSLDSIDVGQGDVEITVGRDGRFWR